MNPKLPAISLIAVIAVFTHDPATAGAQEAPVPAPAKSAIFLDPAELLLRSAPATALQKLNDPATAAEGVAEINKYFGGYATDKSVVLHTRVETAQPLSNARNAFRIRAASIPVQWEGGSMKRQSWLYFLEADAPAANSVKVGSAITVVGWVRKCTVAMTPDGPEFQFDLQHARIESSSIPLSAPAPPPSASAGNAFTTLPMAGTWFWQASEKIYPGTIDFENDGTGSHGARNNTTWRMTGPREITITHTTRGTAVIQVDDTIESFTGTDYTGQPVKGTRLKK